LSLVLAIIVAHDPCQIASGQVTVFLLQICIDGALWNWLFVNAYNQTMNQMVDMCLLV